MKRFIYALVAAVMLFAACDRSNDVELIIGNPDERISDTLNYVKSTLVGAPYGWKAYLTTEHSGGYGFYMEFSNDDRVRMVADLNDATASEIKESTYRVRQIMAANLVFDTYNYITMLQDPGPGTYGGAAGVGLGSDVEFEYKRTSGDTLFFAGRKFGKPLVLVKAINEEQEAYMNGGLVSSINSVHEFFDPNVTVVTLDDIGAELTINSAAKVLSIMAMIGGQFQSVEIPYYYKLNQEMGLIGEVEFNGKKFVSIVNDNGSYRLVSQVGDEYAISKSEEYILPPRFKIGTAITQMIQPGPFQFNDVLPMETWSPSYIADWRNYLSLSMTQGYGLTIGNFFYTFNDVRKTITANGNIYQGSNAFSAEYQMGYTLDMETGYINFTSISGAGNGGIIVPYMEATFFNNMMGYDFTMSFVEDSFFGRCIQFTRVDDPSYYFSWVY